MIETREVTVAKCDACGHTNYADHGVFTAGYALIIMDYQDSPDDVHEHRAYACRETHIGKASKAVLERDASAQPEQPTLDEDPLSPDQPSIADCA